MQALKHPHMLLAVITIIGFLIRTAWLFSNSPLLQKKLVKILPHIIDTLLLATGIGLMIMSQQYPTTYSWLALKILLIIAYIVFGIMLFRANTRKLQALFFVLAISSISSVIYLAHNKPLLW